MPLKFAARAVEFKQNCVCVCVFIVLSELLKRFMFDNTLNLIKLLKVDEATGAHC